MGTLIAVQAAYPVVACAAQYIQLVPVRSLVVTNGTPLSATSTDLANATATTVQAGGAVIKAAPSAINFAPTTVGTPAAFETVTLSNLGGTSATLGTLVTSNQFTTTANCDGAVLPSLGTCQVNVAYAPTQVALGGVQGSLTVPVSANGTSASIQVGMLGTATLPTDGSLATARLLGFSGSDPAMALNSSGADQITFADALFNEQTSSKTFTLSSTGGAPLAFSGLSLSGNDGSFSAGTDCPAQIAAGSSCTVTVTFAPLLVGAKAATLNVSTNAANANTLPVSLRGTATSSATFSVSASTINFGGLDVGQSATQSIAVLNTGNLALTSPTISNTGSFLSSTHNCPPTLDIGARCSASVTFAPSVPANVSGALSISFGNSSTTATVLLGQGLGPVLSADTLIQNFGEVAVGASAARTVTLSNEGNASAPLSFGALPSNVARTDDCASSLAAGAVCHVTLTYNPADVSTLSGMLTVGSTLNSLALNFSGSSSYKPAFTLSTTFSDFAGVATQGSGQHSVTVTNSGNVPLSTPAVSTSGTVFSETHDCAATLAVGATCVATVTFAPTAPQGYFGSLDVSFSNAPLQSTSLAGTGQQAVLVVDAATQAFGNVNIGSRLSRTYTVSNSGNIAAALTISAVSAPVTRGGTCSTTLGAGAACTVVLTYAPIDPTTVNSSLTVSATRTSAALNYSGTGVALPGFGLSATSVAFGSLATGGTSALSVTVSNSGNVPLAMPVISATGEGFTASHDCAASLAVGTSCTVALAFAPTTPHDYAGSLTVAYANASVQSATLAGTGLAALLSVNAPTQAFGNVSIGQTMNKTYTVANNGNIMASLVFGPVSAPVTRGGTCSTTLGAGANCTVVLTYAPTDTAAVSSSLTVSALGTAVTLSYSGTGVAFPGFSLSGTSVAFGGLATGGTTTQSVTVDNSGNVPVTTPAISVSGTGFSASHNCVATLAVGASCTVTLTFSPTAPQAYSGTLSVSYSGLSAQTATLLGTGQQAVLAVDLATQAFGNVSILSTSSKTYTVSNNGNIAATLAIGPVSAPVTRGGTCGVTLDAGATCTVVLTYAPVDTSSVNSFLTVSAMSTSVTLSYAGTGVALPSVSLSSSTVAFGNLATGATAQLAVTVTNTGNVPLNTPTVSEMGTGFSVAHNCAAALAVGASCTATSAFAPTLPQAYSGTLSVAYVNASAQTAALSGTGQQAVLAVDLATQAFGSVLMGASSSLTYTLSNNGNIAATLAIGSALTPVTRAGTCSTVLGASATCTVVLTYTPASTATTSSSLAVSATSTAVTLSYSGTGQVPSTTFQSYNAGNTQVGSNTSGYAVLTNTSAVPVTVTAPSAGAVGANTAGYSWLPGGSQCGGSLAPGATCNIAIAFAPVSAGVALGTVSVNAGYAGTITASLSGTGTAPSAALSGGGNLGLILPPLTASGNHLTLTNTGYGLLTVTGAVSATGSASVWFGASSSYCNSGTVLAPNASCIVLAYISRAPGDYAGTVTFPTTAGTLTLNVSGTVAGGLTASAASFGRVALGSTADSAITVTNTGSYPTYGVSLSASAPYSIVSSACGSSLAGGATCSATVRFSPTSAAVLAGSQVTVSSYYTEVDEASYVYPSTAPGGTVTNYGNTSGTGTWSATTGNPMQYADGTVAASCLAYRQGATLYTPATTSGNYLVNKGAGNETNYCDMATDGGGWTLLARSQPGNTTDWGCAGYPSSSTFTWTSSTGSLTNDAAPYNISAANLPFTQVLFGGYTSGKTWGSYVYRQTVGPNYLTAYANAVLYLGNPTPIVGDNTGMGMAAYMGVTSDTQAYHFRDNTGPGFGLTAAGWATCYTNSLPDWGGYINTQQGMLMAR